VFFDATDLHWCPDVGNGYAPKGEQIKVDSPGIENPWCALLGSLIYPTGEGLYTIHERKRHEEVKVHPNQEEIQRASLLSLLLLPNQERC
jgi:hypothetical protein